MWYGALLIYAALTTLLPSLVLAKPVDFNVLVGPLPEPFHAQNVTAQERAQKTAARSRQTTRGANHLDTEGSGAPSGDGARG